MKKRYLLLIMLGVIIAAVWLACSPAQNAEPSPELLKAAEGLDEISISARMNVEERSINVTQTLKLTNRTGQNQDAAVLRTWPNAFQGCLP